MGINVLLCLLLAPKYKTKTFKNYHIKRIQQVPNLSVHSVQMEHYQKCHLENLSFKFIPPFASLAKCEDMATLHVIFTDGVAFKRNIP